MKILVIDDSPKHQLSAWQTLTEHEVTVVGDYSEALFDKLLVGSDGQPAFDAVLSDLLMPAESRSLGPQGLKQLGHEIPVGLLIAFKAVKVGVGLIAVITDANHHCDPMSSALDAVCPAYWDRGRTELFQVNGSKVMLAHAPLRDDGTKDWGQALETLIRWS